MTRYCVCPGQRPGRWGCVVYLHRTVGNFSVAAMLGAGGELARDAVLGLIHLHLRQKLFGYII